MWRVSIISIELGVLTDNTPSFVEFKSSENSRSIVRKLLVKFPSGAQKHFLMI